MLFFITFNSLWADTKSDVNVLVIQSFHPTFPWSSSFQERLVETIRKSHSFDYQLYFEHLDISRLPDFDKQVFLQYIKTKYNDINFDFIITESAPATDFIDKFKEELNWKARIHYSPFYQRNNANALYFGSNQNYFVERTIDLIIEQIPDLKKLILIESENTPLLHIRQAVMEHLKGYGTIQLEVESVFTSAEIFGKVAEYDDDTAILYNSVFRDSDGNEYTPRQFLQQLAEHSRVPIYGLYSTLLGAGMVGGDLVDASAIASSAANAMEDYLISGSFNGYYPTSQTYIDLTVAREFGLPTEGLSVPITRYNQPVSWAQQNADMLFWGLVSIAVMTVIGLFWIAKLRLMNAKLSFFNDQLEKTRWSLARANSELKRQSLLDPLTGLLNRRAMTPKIEEAIEEFRRYEIPSTIMLIDLDDFKMINDQYGHNVGDTVLKSYSQALTLQSRRTDFLARWGGEEFLILAKGITALEAGAYLKNIRQRTKATQFIDNHIITFSAGVYEISGDFSVQGAVEHADQAMYKAKSRGKDCTVVYGEP